MIYRLEYRPSENADWNLAPYPFETREEAESEVQKLMQQLTPDLPYVELRVRECTSG